MVAEAFKRRLVHSVAVAIAPLYNFVLLLKNFTTNICDRI